MSLLVPFISKTKRADIFNFQSVEYFDKRLPFLEIWHIWVKHCWNYEPSNLLFRFTQHSLEQTKSRQRKTALNSLIYFIWKLLWKEVSGESFKFLDPLTGKWWPFEIFAKLDRKDILSAVFAKFRNDQGCVLTEIHNFN